MSSLWNQIKEAVRSERWAVSNHAAIRLRQRRVKSWQVVAGLEELMIVRVREDAVPNPVVEARFTLPDGTDCECVWAWVERDRAALLVTVYFRY